MTRYQTARRRLDGRLYAMGDAIQSLPSKIRAACCSEYDDLDFSSSHMGPATGAAMGGETVSGEGAITTDDDEW
eukprot:CAMPEP_0182559904 /NCGR_PEP_ID=MMETSP1324-20130603/2844_1 /TAXON_ID=236786 /ORGANISM="Florenciella sp., Strain RCC1587" /LENGTH=73 /DNA_ID=CAMNT_0024772219 /DNA_START=361 /DNA_END=579 /DNA_ORIENTATION=-